jgi:enterobactin synthetase component D
VSSPDVTDGYTLPMLSAFERISLASHPGSLPDAVGLGFTPESASLDAFAAFGIERPASVARSVPKRQAEYLAGRRAAAEALRHAGSIVVDLPIAASRAPGWPQGFIGSISHCQGLAVALAMPSAGRRGAGIDIERIATGHALDSLRSVAVQPDEERALSALASEHGAAAAITLAFSAKESFYKAVSAHAGRIFGFEALAIVGGDPERRVIVGQLLEPLGAELVAGRRIEMGYTVRDDGILLTSHAW